MPTLSSRARTGDSVRTVAVAVMCIIGVAASTRDGGAAPPGQHQAPSAASSVAATTPVTPVDGVSTLHHRGVTIEQSAMGWAGEWSAPSATVPPGASDGRSEPPGGPFIITGADLYRISCRACHRPDGSGAPPEIHALIGPVQAASFEWMMADMQARGRNLAPAFVRQLTASTESDLRTRLRQGGHDMPAFGQISDQEYSVLRPYLDQVAGLKPARPGPRTIVEPADRVGELIVKGTCHICHDATSSDRRPTTVLSDVIPALASLPQDKSVG